jgi:hypothetical protein
MSTCVGLRGRSLVQRLGVHPHVAPGEVFSVGEGIVCPGLLPVNLQLSTCSPVHELADDEGELVFFFVGTAKYRLNFRYQTVVIPLP